MDTKNKQKIEEIKIKIAELNKIKETYTEESKKSFDFYINKLESVILKYENEDIEEFKLNPFDKYLDGILKELTTIISSLKKL